MFLFNFPTMIDPQYLAARAVMAAWIVNTCGSSLGVAGQVQTDIENHNGQPGDGGITALTVTVPGGVPAEPQVVFHHSHGIIGTNNTATGFWIVQPGGLGLAKMVALGRHVTATTYQFLWLAPGYV
ncbi:MAG: hypothetical protein WCH39_25600, partial [Schlesneria sp.]